MHIEYSVLDLWQLYEIDEKQYNLGPLINVKHYCTSILFFMTICVVYKYVKYN